MPPESPIERVLRIHRELDALRNQAKPKTPRAEGTVDGISVRYTRPNPPRTFGGWRLRHPRTGHWTNLKRVPRNVAKWIIKHTPSPHVS